MDGEYHSPYGDDDLYTVQPTERSPRDPKAGEDVTLNITTWPIEDGQNVWVEWTKNGVAQENVTAAYDYNSGNNTYWKADLGKFEKAMKSLIQQKALLTEELLMKVVRLHFT
ncbi:hypothetical protein, partial [Listeria monocytogenes]|uniref:hypothetical protein n=1 Tax=Listeria monocytogenes TaxID=1639 RepID=UPI0039F0752F